MLELAYGIIVESSLQVLHILGSARCRYCSGMRVLDRNRLSPARSVCAIKRGFGLL
jgi:hypothetical protein